MTLLNSKEEKTEKEEKMCSEEEKKLEELGENCCIRMKYLRKRQIMGT